MASPVLMRPTSVSGLVLSSTGTNLGGVGTDGDHFYIKVVSAIMDHRTDVVKVSGDGDQSPNYLPNYWLDVDWMIRGYAIAQKLSGILALVTKEGGSTTINPTSNDVMVRFNIAGGTAEQYFEGRFVIGRIKHEFKRDAAYIGLSMHLRKTALDSGLESYVESAAT